MNFHNLVAVLINFIGGPGGWSGNTFSPTSEVSSSNPGPYCHKAKFYIYIGTLCLNFRVLFSNGVLSKVIVSSLLICPCLSSVLISSEM